MWSLLLVGLVSASELEGTWLLDPGASDPVDPLLDVAGASWLEKKIASNARPSLVVVVEGDTVTLDTGIEGHMRKSVLVTDGTARSQEGQLGTLDVTATWDDGALVTTATGVSKQGKPLEVTVRRSVRGTTLTQSMTVVVDGEAIALDRVFERVPAQE